MKGRVAFTVALSVALLSSRSAAQTSCHDSIIRYRDHFGWSEYYSGLDALVGRLAQLAWKHVQHVHGLDEWWPMGYNDVGGRYDSVLTGLRSQYSDTSIARALVIVMSGSEHGFSDDVAIAASDFYRAWELPPEPAMALVADPYESAASRSAALQALQPRWLEQRIRPLLVACLCDLAAAASSFMAGRDPATLRDGDLLPEDQRELLSRVMRAGWTIAGRASRIFSSVLPSGNPLTAYLARSDL